MIPKAVAFDLDGTLWSCDDVIKRAEVALYAWLQRYYPRIPAAYDREAMRVVRRGLAEQRPALAADPTALRHASLVWHAERAGYDPGLADTGLSLFLTERQKVTPFADVRPALERLAGRVPLIALTNGNADVHATSLGPLFDGALSAADVGAAKPDPALFRAACRMAGVRAGELVHVGDDPLRDIHAARAFGARAIWVDRMGRDWPPDARPPHLTVADIARLPEQLLPGSGQNSPNGGSES